MIDKLTKEQSDRLINLGISADITKDGTFTLLDILYLLPNKIRSCNLTIVETDSFKWAVCYKGVYGILEYSDFQSNYLIHALYDLLVWTIETGYYD